jgi:uncharacterized protein YegP (UPF0339 family)
MKKREPKIVVYKDRKKEWRWRLIAANGKAIANSGEGYKRRIDMLKALGTIYEALSRSDEGLHVYGDDGKEIVFFPFGRK